MKAKAKKKKTYQKAVALEEAGEYNQAILIYEKLGDYKDCMERIMPAMKKLKIKLRYAWKTEYQGATKKEASGDYSGAFQIYEEIGRV